MAWRSSVGFILEYLTKSPALPLLPNARNPPHLAELQRLARTATRFLRAVKRRSCQKALAVALAVTLAFPSVHAPARLRSAAVDGGGSVAPVEIVVPAEGTAESGRSNAGERHAAGKAGRVHVGVGGSRAAFIARPQGDEGVGRRTVVAAVTQKKGKRAKKDSAKDSTGQTLKSLAQSVGDNGKSIAIDFGGHIQVKSVLGCSCW